MSDNTFWAFCWLCSSGIILAVIAAIGFNYYDDRQFKETLVGKHGIDPIIIECIMEDEGKNSTPKFILCQKAFEQYKITTKDITKLRKVIDR